MSKSTKILITITPLDIFEKFSEFGFGSEKIIEILSDDVFLRNSGITKNLAEQTITYIKER